MPVVAPNARAAGGRALAALVTLLLAPAALAYDEPTAGSATPTTVKLPSGPGSIRGLGEPATVSIFSGQVGTSVPFDLPKGPAGFGPSLALSYHGGLGNGPAGIGWTLAPPHIARSTERGRPTFTDADTLELSGLGDGSQLFRLSDGSYRLEGAGQRVRVLAVSGGFDVWTADGVRYRMDYRQAASPDGPAFAWYPTVIENPAGLRIELSYATDEGDVNLVSLRWATVPGSNAEPRYGAWLTYEPRPDAVVSYRSGFEVVTRRRLARVDVTSAGRTVRSYALAYDPDDQLPVSRLVEVRMTGLDGEGAMPPLNFDYGAPAAPDSFDLAGADGWQLNVRGGTLADVDGDGLSDLVRFESGVPRTVKLNLGGTFGPPSPLPGGDPRPLSEVRLMDLDGDLRAEMVYVVDDTWRVYRLGSSGFDLIGEWPGSRLVPLHGPSVAFADVDGDHRTDVLRQGTDGLWLHRGTASGLAAPVAVPLVSPADSGLSLSTLELQDVNGDGLADAVTKGDEALRVFLGRGDGTFVPSERWSYPWPKQYTDPEALRLADLNRDGLVDIVRIEPGHVYWWAGRPGGFGTALAGKLARPPGSDYDDVVTLADVNGNGSLDVVWSSGKGLWALDLAGTTTQAMLRAVRNGLGATTTFHYSTSTRMSLEASAAGQPWSRQLATTLAIPWRTAVISGAPGEPPRVTAYRVRDGFWDAARQRLGGFLTTLTTNEADTPSEQLVVETQYEPGLGASRVLRGKAWHELTYDGTGKVFSEVFNVWEPMALPALPAGEPMARVAVLRDVVTDVYEGQTEPLTTRTVTDYDGEANAVRVTEHGRLDLGGDEAVTERRYAANDQTWVRGVVCAERLSELSGTLVRYSRHQYDVLTALDQSCDADAAELCECSVTQGRNRATDGWLAPVPASALPPDADTEVGRWVRLSEVDYDDAGNPTRTTQGGVTRHLGYDGAHVHPIAEWVEPTPGFELRWTLDWDPITALPVRLTDPNGDAKEVGYDALGRLVEVRVPLGEPASLEPVMTVEYHLGTDAPGPHVVTRRLEHGLAPDGELVSVVNGLGEPRYEATRVDDARRSISGFRKRSSRGLTTLLALPFFWSAPGLPTELPPAVATQSVTYDATGRAMAQHLPATDSLPEGSTTTTNYAPFRSTKETSWTLAKPGEATVDEHLAPVTHVVDGRGRIVHTTRAIDDTTEWADNTYDASSALTTTRLQGGAAVHAFTYDTLGRLRHGHDADIGHRYTTWNDAGQVIATENGVGDRIEYDYDGAGRLTSLQSDATGVAYDEAFAFTYDHAGTAPPSDTALAAARAAHQLGRLVSVVEPWGAQVLRYDARGKEVASERSIDEWATLRESTYSPSGKVLTSTVRTAQSGAAFGAERFRLTYGFDAAGWLASIRYAREAGTPADLWTRADVTAGGATLKAELGNGLDVHTERDVLDQSTRLRFGSLGATPLYDVSLVRNGFGSIAKVIEHPAVSGSLTRAATFGYDGAARLTTATVGGMHFGYAYDALQNITERTVDSGGLDLHIPIGPYHHGEGNAPGLVEGTGPRQLTSAGGVTFKYDRAGRMTHRGADALAYDARDRLRNVALANGTTLSYRYGADGNQIDRLENNTVVDRRFDEGLVQRLGRFELVVSAGSELIARLAVPEITGQPLTGAQPIQYLHQGLGHGPSLVTDASGALLEERLYEPFGVLLAEEAASAGAYGLEPFAWNGKIVDPVTGWSDHGARWDATELARWLTADPPVKGPDPKRIGAPWDLNPYAFVRQNPVLLWDPDGLSPPDRIILRYKTSAVVISNAPDGNGYVVTGMSNGKGFEHRYDREGYTAWERVAQIETLMQGEINEDFVEPQQRQVDNLRQAVLRPYETVLEFYFATVGGGGGKGGGVRSQAKSPKSGVDAAKRPGGFRKKTVQDAWDNAPPGAKSGSKACPTCSKDVDVPPGQGRRDWDVDHQPPWKARETSGKTRKEVLDDYNKGTRLECPGCNRSRGADPAE